jgi:predicted dehydrogenase
MLIEAVDGSVHLARAKPFLVAGIPCFVDKPFTCSLADAKAMAELAVRKKVLVWSSSALRYAAELTAYLADTKHGPILGAVTWGPCSLHDRNPGLFHYGIHAVEMLYALMGPGCVRVGCDHQADADVVTGTWADGRTATVRGTRKGPGVYGFVGFAEKGTQAVAVSTGDFYRELLKKVVEGFTTGKAPVDIAVTLEMVAFIEAANKSGANHGAGEKVKV